MRENKQGITFSYIDGVETSNVEGRKLNCKGTKRRRGTISINSSREVAIAIHDGKYCAEKGYDKSKIIITEKESDECQLNGDSETPIAPNFTNTYGGSNADYFGKVSIVSNGYVAVGFSLSDDGNFEGLNKGNKDAFIIKVGSDGEYK